RPRKPLTTAAATGDARQGPGLAAAGGGPGSRVTIRSWLSRGMGAHKWPRLASIRAAISRGVIWPRSWTCRSHSRQYRRRSSPCIPSHAVEHGDPIASRPTFSFLLSPPPPPHPAPPRRPWGSDPQPAQLLVPGRHGTPPFTKIVLGARCKPHTRT